MNVFVILLMALFMAGYYLMDAPNVSLDSDSRMEAIDKAELKSVLECVIHAHSEALLIDQASNINQKNIFTTTMPCAEMYNVQSQKLCDENNRISKLCTPERSGKSISNYIITTTDIITENGAGKALELLGKDYPYALNFGIISIGDDKIPRLLSSGGVLREIAKSISASIQFTAGQLVYISQYAASAKKNPIVQNQIKKINCDPNQVPVFRHNAWACVSSNFVPICSGDFIWDSSKSSCILDPNKHPLCGSNESAVMAGGVWECISSEQGRVCPPNYTAELDHKNMEWVCVLADGGAPKVKKKCEKVYDKLYGGGTSALRGKLISCNDCETMIVHDDCTAECIPNAAAVMNKQCYAGNCENFYFGFPNAAYINDAKKNIAEITKIAIPLDESHSRNRKFNCIECVSGINEVASSPPYVIVCN